MMLSKFINSMKSFNLLYKQWLSSLILLLVEILPPQARNSILPCNKSHSLCNTTITPIIPSMTCFNQGCSLSNIVTYPTKGMKPITLPMTSSLRFRKDWPAA